MILALLLAIAPHVHEGDVQAFVSMTDAQGAALADGKYAQRVEGDVLHIDARYDFADGRVVEEHATLRLHPRLEQTSWEWTEKRDGAVLRRFTADFDRKRAYALRVDQGKAWDEQIDVEPGKTFAGIGFVTAIKNLRGVSGESFDLKAIAFTPKPRSVGVEIHHDGADTVHISRRTLAADRWTIHPQIPAIAKLFVKAPDQHVWLLKGDPPSFLRFEGPLAEPDDPVIRIDSVPSLPVARRGRTGAPQQARSPSPTRRARR